MDETLISYPAVDLEKAKTSPLTGFTLRLMAIENDLQTLRYLHECLLAGSESKTKASENMRVISDLHLFRLQLAHIHEAIDATQKAIQKQSEIKDFISKHEELDKLLESVFEATTKEEYKASLIVRNQLTFHYNHDGKVLLRGLYALIDEGRAKNDTFASIQHDASIGGVYSINVLGALVVQKACLNIFEHSDNDEGKAKGIRDFLDRTGGDFLAFANTFIRLWMEEVNS